MEQKSNNNLIITVLIATVFGLLSGVVGYLVLGSIFYSWFGQVNLNEKNGNVVIEQPRNVVVSQDLQIKQVENNILPTLATFYPAKKAVNIIDKVYLPSEALGQGIVLTADGWLVTSDQVLTNLSGDYVVVGYQNKQYTIEQMIHDSLTGVVFAKISANNLTVVQWGDSDKLIPGQLLVGITERKKVVFTNVGKIDYEFITRQDLWQSSENLGKKISLALASDMVSEGMAMADFKGQVLGLMRRGQMLPANYLMVAIKMVLEKQAIKYPTLGIKYLDLSHVDGVLNIADNGALVAGPITKTSGAYGKLLENDVIKKVDGVELNAFKSLSEILRGYRPGDKIDLTVLRKNQEVIIEVQLN
ncbi:MAG: S1C family serine protease [bacterium]